MSHRTRLRPWLAGVLVGLTLVAGVSVAGARSSMQAPLPVGRQAPDWTLMDRHGEARNLADHRGEYVLLDFWATWCAPCRAVMPRVQAIHEQYKEKGVVVYGVNMSEQDPQDAVKYVDDHGYTYGLLLEGDEVADDYSVHAIPTLFLIDPDGKIIYTHQGVLDGNAFESFIRNALRKRPAAPRKRARGT